MPRSRKIRRVAVLGSGKIREQDPIYQQALKLGRALAQKGFSVYHGGYRGAMEAVSKGCRLSGGRNVGVTIRGASKKANFFIDTEIRMPSWKERLFKLIKIGDAYVFLDGATGTLAELFVVIEMTNRGLLKKPIIILGKGLSSILRMLKKDPHFNLPPTLHFAASIPKTIRLLQK